ncbi:FkbM family methyltransferase [uncultured Phenylobacterium sp.]|uniref:FkbM family methyltransferase n=1 Tax=uncultured Phenylobacterium sp. TaxID=349273 RepID=UPI0025E112CC|nr:FkbM family methyltransferase [uncultured Phenylobacterium sp.]
MNEARRSALADLLGFDGQLEIADIGAAYIGTEPPYGLLLETGLARLNAFDADERQHPALRAAYGERVQLFGQAVGDGKTHTLHLAAPASGRTSLLKPSAAHLGFFNGFDRFGAIESTRPIATTRLDDIAGLPDIDFLKMDIQGAELMALQGGEARLARCVAIQLEVSFVPLYENQPSFGEIDIWMRAHGFLPHTFAELKRWSIAPVVRNNDVRDPFNQLLEADIVYVRDPVTPDRWDADLLRRLILIVHYVYGSVDLAGRLAQHLGEAGHAPPDALARYLEILHAPDD